MPPAVAMRTPFCALVGLPKTNALVGLGTVLPPGFAPAGMVIANGPANGVVALVALPQGSAGSTEASDRELSNAGVHSRTRPEAVMSPHEPAPARPQRVPRE